MGGSPVGRFDSPNLVQDAVGVGPNNLARYYIACGPHTDLTRYCPCPGRGVGATHCCAFGGP
jgi:hypothetical protein